MTENYSHKIIMLDDSRPAIEEGRLQVETLDQCINSVLRTVLRNARKTEKAFQGTMAQIIADMFFQGEAIPMDYAVRIRKLIGDMVRESQAAEEARREEARANMQARSDLRLAMKTV